MNSLKEIASEIVKGKSALVYPHTFMDGDCLGSSVALVRVLRAMGKEAYILKEDKIPDNLMFLDRGYSTDDPMVIEDPDMHIAVDCYGEDRMPERWERFISGRVKITLDHHATAKEHEGLFYVDPEASATGEIIYDLIEELGADIDVETAEALFAAITTDTGNYQYTNCNAKAHEITAELYRKGLDANKVSNEIYANISPEKIKLESLIIETLEFIAGGRGAIVHVTQDMLREADAPMEYTEGVVGMIRNISGVELAALVKENAAEEIRVSMRAKGDGDVAVIGEKYGGGGHVKAAGCTLYMSIQEALEEIRKSFEEALR